VGRHGGSPLSRRPQLCFVLPEWDHDTDGHFAHTVQGLEVLAQSVDLEVIVQHARGEPRIAGACRVMVQTARWRPLRLLQLARFVLAARRRGCRAIYVHYSYSGAILGGLLARLTGARAHYWHCGQAKQFYPRWSWSRSAAATKLGDELPLRLALRLSHRLVTGSPRMAEYYAREFGVPPEKILIVPNDIALARFADRPHRMAARAALGLPAHAPVILFVHRLAPRKGAHHLVPIAELVRTAFPDVVFLVAGTGPLRDALGADIKARGLAGTVRLVGPIPNRQIANYYAAADVLLMPSDEEGFPRVLLEAQAMGTPFVASDVGGVLDIVTPRQAEFVVPRGMIEAFADGVTRLLKDPALRAVLAEDGVRNVARFDVHRVMDRLVAALFPESSHGQARGGP
jgi:glycosyltransferase involved in cell wall biosynthesis